MCGFSGYISVDRFSSLCDDLPNAVSSLAHRGPDDSGLYFDRENGVGLGHRRLSVIDLSNLGRQPMGSDDGRVHIAYNGEVYNFRKIRRTLEGYGHHFTSETDTEVVLKSYLQWGVDCFRRFIGMFSLALWDKGNQRLLLSRDRLGIKPLYYYFNKGTLIFASELKALMAFKDFKKEIDPDALPLFLHYQYITAPKTVFINTYKLLPGHFLEYRGQMPTCYSYWMPPQNTDKAEFAGMSEEDLIGELDEVLTHAVSDRLISDVPLGGLLSGGIDSSIVVALMQKAHTSSVQTFSIGFREPEYDEAPWAARVAQHLGTDHTESYVTPKEAVEVIPKLPEIYDEPFADTSAIPTYLLSTLARTQLTVALSGDGGDEQFAGYVRYWSTSEMWSRFGRIPRSIRRATSSLARRVPYWWVNSFYAFWSQSFPKKYRTANFPDKWQKLLSMSGEGSLLDFYRKAVCLWSLNEIFSLTGRLPPESLFEQAFRENEQDSLMKQFMGVDQKTYLPDDLLTKVDRASMAMSLEVRVPLLDHRILEFTSKLPDTLKCRDGQGKYLLKKLLSRYVPNKLIDRPKMGFGVPIDAWFRRDLKTMLQDYLSPERLNKGGMINPTVVEQKIREHISGKAKHQYKLWALLMWEMWKERWMN